MNIRTDFLRIKIFQIFLRVDRLEYWNMHLSDLVLTLGPLIILRLSIVLEFPSWILDKEEIGFNS